MVCHPWKFQMSLDMSLLAGWFLQTTSSWNFGRHLKGNAVIFFSEKKKAC